MKQWNIWSRRAAMASVAIALLPASALADAAPQVKFETSLGDFVVEVYPDKAPKTVDNFLQYVKAKQYDGTIFHRVINNFMVQGGGYTTSMSEKPTRPPVPLEAQNGLKNDLGTIAMARTNDPNSATAQFFVNVKNNDFLNAKGPADGYTVFGKVIKGQEVVDAIKAVPTTRKGFHDDVPRDDVVIEKAVAVG